MFVIFKCDGEVKVIECRSEALAVKLVIEMRRRNAHEIEWAAVICVVSTLNNRYTRCPYSYNVGAFAATVEFEKLFE